MNTPSFFQTAPTVPTDSTKTIMHLDSVDTFQDPKCEVADTATYDIRNGVFTHDCGGVVAAQFFKITNTKKAPYSAALEEVIPLDEFRILQLLNPSKFSHPSSCLLYTSPSPRDGLLSRMPSSA